MSQLSICLFGAPTFVLDGQQVMLDRWKAVALLAYLALEERSHRRDGLATLFWPELSQAQARNGLRRTLNALKHALGAQWLGISRETVQIRRSPNLSVDVWRFRELLTSRQGTTAPPVAALQQAVALYRDDLLAGFTLRDAPAFEDWRYFAAEELRHTMAIALDSLLRAQRESGDLSAALRTARRWLALDPLEEDAHRALIELHLAAGDRAAARREYEHCVQILAQELDVEPDARTRALLEAPPVLAAAMIPTPSQPAVPDEDKRSPVLVDAVRQIVVLNLGIVGWPEGAHRRDQQQQLGQFLSGATATLKHYAAHIDHLGADGAVAFFGIPHGHEDDAERALHVAFALYAAARTAGIQLAAGIKIGPSLVSWHQQQDVIETREVFGAVLGQAAELQRAAAPGQILVDRVTYLHTRSTCSFDATTVPLRGQSEATQVYAALAELHLQKTRGIPDLKSRLVGREAEMAALEQAIYGLAAGAGQVLLLTGEAGIGKSRLVTEVRGRCPQQILWLEGRCLEMTTATSYWPFQDALRDYFGWQLNVDKAAQAQSLRSGLERLVAALKHDEESCAEIGAVLGKLFALRFANNWDNRLENAAPTELRHRIMVALRTLLAAIAHTQPLVLVLEDLHWADDASLDLINELLPAVQSEALLLFCIYRPVPGHRCSQLPVLAARKCPARYQALQLRELTPAQTEEMVAALLEIEALSPATKGWILERAQGNPYFTEEVILALIEAGFIRREARVWHTHEQARGALANVELPYSVDQLILTRVDRLAAPLRQTVEAAAVLGRTFPLPVLSGVTANAGDLAAQISELEERSLLYCEHAEPVAEFSFRHVLIQEAVYQMLPDARRNDLHLRAAQTMEALYADNRDAYVDALAYHYARSSDHVRAVSYLMKAGTKARRGFANGAAIAYFQQALEHLAQLDGQGEPASHHAWCEAWSQLGRAYHAVGSHSLAETAFRQAIAQAQAAQFPAPAVVRLVYWLGEALYWQGKDAEVVAAAQGGLALLLPDSSCCETVLMLGHWMAAAWRLGDLDQSRACVRRILPIVSVFPFTEELSPAYHHVIFYFKDRNDAGAALEWIETLRIKAVEQQDRTSLTKAVLLHGITLSEQGDYAGAVPLLQEALALSLRIDEATFLYFCFHRLALNAIMLGEAEAACQYADKLLEIMRAGTTWVAIIHEFCGFVHLSAGRLESALAFLTGNADERARGEMTASLENRYWLGCALSAAGRVVEAQQTFRELLELCKPDYPPPPDFAEMKPLYWTILSALDRLLDDPGAFRAFCDAHRARWSAHCPAGKCFWHPVPAQATIGQEPCTEVEISDCVLAQWQWCDPFRDGAYHIENGVELVAADGRDLWYINMGAPSLRTSVEGDFALQVHCRSASLRPLTMGGLLLWHDPADFMRLDWGGLGAGEISCLGWMGGAKCFWGRARSRCGQPCLRLERSGDRVRALFSEDDRQWLLVGETVLAAGGEWEIGLFALGAADRILYPGAPAGGAAIRFDEIQLWRG